MKMGSVRAGGTPTEMAEPRSVRITGLLFLNTSIKAAPAGTNPRDWGRNCGGLRLVTCGLFATARPWPVRFHASALRT